jgi:HPt (histidine-containing phosphotransfer) domain-containing protein
MQDNYRYNIEGFAGDLGLPVEEIADLFAEFIKVLGSEKSKLKVAAVEKDWIMVKNIIHNIKGVTGNYRITDVYNEALLINNVLKKGDYGSVEQTIKSFCNLLEAAVEEIKKYFLEKGIAF